MKPITALALLALGLAGCESILAPALPTPAPLPTYTALPTYTPYPTYTPPPTYTPFPNAQNSPPAATRGAAVSRCIGWTDAAAHMNETTCVRGTVYSTYQSGSAFFIDFDDTRSSFYAVSFQDTFEELRGQCVELSGKITPYRGRPEIVIETKDQVKRCGE